MKRISAGSLLAVFVLMSMFALAGCPKKAEVSSTPEAQKVTPAPAAPAEDQAAKEAEAKKAAEAEAARKAEEERLAREREAAAKAAEGLKPIHFDFDQAVIRSDAKDVMKANAAWLKSHGKAKVSIEGNCDERGTIEYNQALGQRRAAAAKKYLVDLGISAKRISLISYGKEKPVCSESTEECWQKNRRDDFIPAE
ncbi:MAG: peptidoglycan-associated lipoprotein Pal [Nitrospiraceae bacterium]|nr:peptidoglycan-associated lipoprotein Pal [Nitrospiraceae bacterium]